MEFNRPTNIIPAPWAENGQYETIPATQVSSGRASWDTGFPPENTIPVSSGGIPANYNDFQGVLHDLSEHTCFQQTGGMYLWSSSIDYPVGAVVQGSDNGIYRALVKNGPNTTVANPVTDSSGKWTSFVMTDGNQTISGGMIVTSDVTVSGGMTVTSGATISGGMTVSGTISGTTTNASSLGGVAASGYVTTSGAQTITGAKTFSSSTVFSNGIMVSSGGATIRGNFYVYPHSSGTANIYVDNQYTDSTAHKIALLANSGGNAGVWDSTKNKWLFVCDTAGAVTFSGTATNATSLGGVAASGYVTTSGDQTINGTKTFNETIVSTKYPSLKKSTNNTTLTLLGGATTEISGGAKIQLNGGEYSTNTGFFIIQAGSGTTYTQLIGEPAGALTWGGTVTASYQRLKQVNPYLYFVETDWEKGGATSVTTYQGVRFQDKNEIEGGSVFLHYYTNKNCELSLTVADMHASSATGSFAVNLRYAADGNMFFIPNNANVYLGYSGNNRWKQLYATTTTIATSDERQKTSISVVPDAVLDAWGDVSWSQFQMRDAVAEKGEDKARLHNGLIAQRIDAVFKAHGLNACRYGFFCHDTWEAEPEERDPEGKLVHEALPAGDEYSLRYEEALCMEAAYQRRRADRAEARISALEQRLGELEAVLASLIAPIGDEQTEAQEGEGADA